MFCVQTIFFFLSVPNLHGLRGLFMLLNDPRILYVCVCLSVCVCVSVWVSMFQKCVAEPSDKQDVCLKTASN